MRRLVASINMTLDGFCDHTSAIADDELHQHYTDLLRSGGDLLYGRITYQLMESYWPTVVKNPTGNKRTADFAAIIENIPKTVFSRTLSNVNWKNVKLAKRSLEEEVLELKQSNNHEGKDILVGSPSLIAALTKLNLFDEYQLCIHPVIAGHGLPLFKNINDSIVLKLVKTKALGGGQIVLYYEPLKK